MAAEFVKVGGFPCIDGIPETGLLPGMWAVLPWGRIRLTNTTQDTWGFVKRTLTDEEMNLPILETRWIDGVELVYYDDGRSGPRPAGALEGYILTLFGVGVFDPTKREVA